MICSKCQTSVSDDSHFCSACGAPTRGGVAVAELDDPHIEALLAEANLLRMRGRWPEAEARCIEVMRAEPNNVHAHSLLGDIYLGQGRHEEAAQWYRLALDLSPNNAADLAKLAHVEREVARQAARTLLTPTGSGDSGRVGTQNLLGLSPVLWLRGLTALSVVFMVLVVILLVAMRNNRRVEPISPTGTLSGPTDTSAAPTLAPNLPSSGVTGTQAPTPPSDTARSAPLRTNAPPTTQYRNGTTAKREQATAPNYPIPTPRFDSAYSTGEAALQTYLVQQSGLGADTTINSVTIYPGERWVTVLLIRYQTDPNADIDTLRKAVAQDTLRVAQTAFTADAAIERVTVSTRMNIGAGYAEPIFEGHVERAKAQNLAPDATLEQMLAAFSRVWWSEALSPAPPASGTESAPNAPDA